jgi:thiosulfate/3-mercaptopyruvate sulfurtransferase
VINRRRPVPVPTAKKSIVVRLLALWVGLTFVIPGFTAPLLERPGLVSTEWLAERIGHPDLRILDARVSLRSYLGGHVPGAVYLNTETIRISRGGIPASLLPPEQIAEILGHIGLANHHTVVIYSSADEAFSHAAYVAFLLEWLGHQAIGVVDGGIEKWQHEGRSVSRKFPFQDSAIFQIHLNPEILESAERVTQAIKGPHAVVLDAREPQPFAAGHLPTARNFFHQQTLTGTEIKTWKSPEELRTLAAALGADGSQPIMTYCTSGRESAQLWFTLRHVARLPNVSSYHGSWIDWTARGLPAAGKE